ncbi:MAG: NAD(P)/FAD-dependent oxidoreductase [Clostridia bacterium]|nr:NAD(P)/FAD-dependent oxidoreductase [Clostridia bacterium]
MKKDHYGALIVGAGPSGLSCALNLYKNGYKDIAVVERAVFPRYKCCAGYITGKTKKEYEKLGIDIESCRYSLIADFNIYYNCKKRQNIVNKFLYTNAGIDRVELDFEFYKKAASLGIEIAENVKITEHDPQNRTLTLSDGQIIEYDNLVFADGASGFSSRYTKAGRKNIAMQLIFDSDLPDGIDIHFGITKRGYGWVSTCNGKTNAGLTDVYDPGLNYKDVFASYLDRIGIKADLSDLRAAYEPIGIKKTPDHGNVYFIGDAAGCCDPLTLSGLRYGLASGEAAAAAIVSNDPSVYKKFLSKLKSKFAVMSVMQRVFYLKSTLFCVFCVGCRVFRPLISRVFNNFFVNKK